MEREHKPVIEVNNVFKSFKVGSQDVQVLKDVSIKIKDGDFAVIFGPSGCGKSTLLHTILGLEKPNGGNVVLFGHDIYRGTTEDDRAIFRKQLVGMVFQQSNWIKALDVKENVAFPLTLLGIENIIAQEKAKKVLEQVGMAEWADYVPTELSFGQQQRVSLARALIHSPEVIIADEPTGNLDYESGQHVMQLLYDLNKRYSKTIIMVTHDLEYLRYANYLIQVFDGEIIGTYGEKQKEELLKDLNYKRGVINNNKQKDD